VWVTEKRENPITVGLTPKTDDVGGTTLPKAAREGLLFWAESMVGPVFVSGRTSSIAHCWGNRPEPVARVHLIRVLPFFFFPDWAESMGYTRPGRFACYLVHDPKAAGDLFCCWAGLVFFLDAFLPSCRRRLESFEYLKTLP